MEEDWVCNHSTITSIAFTWDSYKAGRRLREGKLDNVTVNSYPEELEEWEDF